MKFPPPLIAIAALLFEWALAQYVPIFQFQSAGSQIVGIILALCAVLLTIASVPRFLRSKTTLNPFGTPSTFLTTGIYRVTRNPMYLSLTTLLLGGACYFGAVSAFIAPVVFVWLMMKYFIAPEEVMMAATFGDSYLQYKSQVRRWL